MRFARSVWIVARNELSDSIRSRRAAVLLVLYAAGTITLCNWFIVFFHSIESQMSTSVGLTPPSSAGAITGVLWESPAFKHLLSALIGDPEVADHLTAIPPIALIYGWIAFTFTPALVMLATSPRVADEVSAGSIRFAILRTSRSAWCLGKFVGQVMTVLIALLTSVLAAWLLAHFRVAQLDDIAVLRGMLLHAAKAGLYCFAFIGLALGLSQTVRSPNVAMALGLLALMLTTMGGFMFNHHIKDGGHAIWGVLFLLIPQGHKQQLWYNDAAHLTSATTYLLTLGMVYFSAGYAVFVKKDL